jgi:hypothetical protein
MVQRIIPLPSVPIVDPRTGLMTVDWYDFFAQAARVATVNLSFGSSVKVDAAAGNNFRIDATSNANFTIAAPTGARNGQIITLMVANRSGGALGTVTFDPIYHFSSAVGQPPKPGNNQARIVGLLYDGAFWLETFRSVGDIPIT